MGGASAPAFADEHADLPPTHSVQPQMVATGFEFAEGPVLNARGDLFVANYRRLGTIGRIAADGTAGIFCDLDKLVSVEGRAPQAHGLEIDGRGRLIAADFGAGRLLRIAADGASVEVLADRWEATRFDGVDDVALDRTGNIYFSDPGESDVKNPTGSVYRYDVGTKKVSRIATDLAHPNGLGVSPDQKHLCVAESVRYRLLIYDLGADGTLTDRRVLIDFPTETRGEIIGGVIEPEGLIFDEAGRLYVAMWNGGVINVVEVPSGRLIRQYDAGGKQVTNCYFHGGYLYTTVVSKEAVFRLKLGVKGFDYSEPPEPQ
ncbi:MAG: hypothetical protein A2V70_09255 [Planctomycetes bacterium RBG_13_63_9]|nr:MAG: hypothetical protein A2V70_09255 [Planctomycetes bacterium RBG_13_63_9]